MYMGAKLGISCEETNIVWDCWRSGCWGGQAGEDFIVKSFIHTDTDYSNTQW